MRTGEPPRSAARACGAPDIGQAGHIVSASPHKNIAARARSIGMSAFGGWGDEHDVSRPCYGPQSSLDAPAALTNISSLTIMLASPKP